MSFSRASLRTYFKRIHSIRRRLSIAKLSLVRAINYIIVILSFPHTIINFLDLSLRILITTKRSKVSFGCQSLPSEAVPLLPPSLPPSLTPRSLQTIRPPADCTRLWPTVHHGQHRHLLLQFQLV